MQVIERKGEDYATGNSTVVTVRVEKNAKIYYQNIWTDLAEMIPEIKIVFYSCCIKFCNGCRMRSHAASFLRFFKYERLSAVRSA